MRRRDLLGRIGAASLAAGTVGGRAVAAGGDTDRAGESVAGVASGRQETIGETYWDSTSSLLTTGMEPITSDENVLVRARETAVSTDEDGNGDAVSYGDTRPVLAARDGRVVGLGAMLADDEVDFAFGNDEFLLNVWDVLAGGGRVVWDTGHDQFWVPSKFSAFVGRAEEVGYTVEATDDLAGSLSGADLAVVTTPAAAFSDAELSALAEFRANGGAVVLHDQSDFENFDQTDNMNAIAAALELPFRFNDDQVIDEENNAGAFFQPATDVYLGDSAFFAAREGVPDGPAFQFDREYTATVGEVSDGDTFAVTFDDGAQEEVRVLGIDTPEVAAAADAENPDEWEGLGDEESGDERDGEYPYLQRWAEEASTAAEETLAGETVTLTFDEAEGIEDPFGRLLAFVQFDADGSGSRDRFWSRELIDNGLARVFDSSNARHDTLIEAELAARADGRGVWAESDPTDSRTLRNEPVEQLFFADPVAVESFGGELPDERVPVRAPDSASTAGAPLVAVDQDARVAAVGGVPVADDFFGDEFPVDPTAYGNEPFLTALIDALSGRTESAGEPAPDVVWDGGHGQFDVDAGVSVEAAATYQRYLEGVDLGLEQVNDYGTLLSRGRGLVVTPGRSGFTDEQMAAVRSFRDAGGSVVVAGAASVESNRLGHLNALLAELGSDLALDVTGVSDSASPEGVVTTDAVNDAFGLFDAFQRDAATLAGTSTATADSPTEAGTTAGGTTASGTTAGEADQTATETPGFGAAAGLAGVVGGGIVAARRLLGEDAGSE